MCDIDSGLGASLPVSTPTLFLTSHSRNSSHEIRKSIYIEVVTGDSLAAQAGVCRDTFPYLRFSFSLLFFPNFCGPVQLTRDTSQQ